MAGANEIESSNERFENSDFSGLELERFSSVASQFIRCSFTGIQIDSVAFGGGMIPSLYSECNFDHSVLHIAVAGNARFERCTFLETRIHGWNSQLIEMVDCEFSGHLNRIIFYGRPIMAPFNTVRQVNEFSRNDFEKCIFGDINFRGGIDLSSLSLPNDDRYLYVPDAVAAHAEVLRRERPGWRPWIEIIEDDIADGQLQLWYDLSKRAKKPGHPQAEIAEILREFSSPPPKLRP